MQLKKSVLAVSLALGAVTAHAASKTPTLAEVLKVSDLTLSGYVDVSYTNLSGSGLFTSGTANRVFDRERNSANLQMVDLSIAYQPKDGIGAFVQLSAGNDADVIAAAGTRNDDQFDVQEAYLQFAKGPFTLVTGKFATLHGAEVIESHANVNFSRSILFGYAIPFTHTGLRLNYDPGKTVKFSVGVNNGWDVVKESAATNRATNGEHADGKTFEFSVTATPIKPLILMATVMTGDEAGAVVGRRDLLDVVVTYNRTDKLAFIVNYDYAKQEGAVVASADAKWSGLAGYVTYKINDKWRVAGRAEYFDDKNGYRTGVVQKWKENTLTLAYAPSKNTELRGEVRYDFSNVNSFAQTSGTPRDNQTSFGLQAIYKF